MKNSKRLTPRDPNPVISDYDYSSDPTPPSNAHVSLAKSTQDAITDAALAFLSKKQICSLVRLTEHQLDEACSASFRVNLDQYINLCRLKMHSAFVKRLSELSVDGNQTALKLMSQIVGTASQNSLADSGIKISLDISSSHIPSNDDDDDDGGVHL